MEIKISNVYVLIKDNGIMYPKLFLDKKEAEDTSISKALKDDGFKVQTGFI